MQHKSQEAGGSKGLTLLEMTISMAIMAVLFAVLVPQLRLISNSWDSKAGRSDALQDGCVLLDHLQRQLSTARRINAVSGVGETLGYIEFEDNDASSFRYDINGSTSYVEFGVLGNLHDLAGPVSQFQMTCYDPNDMINPMNPITDPNLIRFVKVEVTLTNSAAMGGDLTLITSEFLRSDYGSTIGDANDPSLLFVVANATSLTSQEVAKKALIEGWGYPVTLISDEDSQAEFDAAVAANEVVYISLEVSEIDLGTKLRYATTGVVIEKITDNFGIAAYWQTKSRTDIDIIDNSHHITSPFSVGVLTCVTSLQPLTLINSGGAPDLTTLAQTFNVGSNWDPGLVVIDLGGELQGGGTAAGPRVQLPWGGTGFDINSLNADGQTIMQRAIEWAADGAGAAPGSDTYADSFAGQAFNGSSGTLDWSTSPWVEIGEADGVSSGDCGVFNDAGLWRLRVRDNDNGGEGVEREADLLAARSATLEFWYRRYRLDNAGDYVKLEISANGAAGPWTEILRLQGPANDPEYLLESQDISAYIASNTRIRFITSPNMGKQDAVWFDDVEIVIQP